jgi:hypothetical protein
MTLGTNPVGYILIDCSFLLKFFWSRNLEAERHIIMRDASDVTRLKYLLRAVHLLQQLQVSCNLVYHALRRRSNAQHCRAATCNLCPSRVVDNVRCQSQAQRLRLQHLQLLLALDLQRHLGLAQSLPASQYRRVRCGAQEVLVAGECRVSTLCANLACGLSDVLLGDALGHNIPLVMPRSVLTTKTILHSSLLPLKSAGAVSSSSLSSSLDSSESSAAFSSRCAEAEIGLPPNRPSDFAWPTMYPVTPATMAHATAMFAVDGCVGSCIVCSWMWTRIWCSRVIRRRLTAVQLEVVEQSKAPVSVVAARTWWGSRVKY